LTVFVAAAASGPPKSAEEIAAEVKRVKELLEAKRVMKEEEEERYAN
jgi:hypothetical protein